MNRKLTYLFGTIFAVPLIALVLLTNIFSPSENAQPVSADRVAAGELQCNFEGYEGVLNYEEAIVDERIFYALGMGYANKGSQDAHKALHAAFTDLTFDLNRTPIVSADLEKSRLHVFDCAATQCTREEIARDAPMACMEGLSASSCMTFAVRVNGNYHCTLGPGLGQ